MKKILKKNLLNFSKTFSFEENLVLPTIYGEGDKFLDQIENSLKVRIITRGNIIKIEGLEENVNLAEKLLNNLYNLATKNNEIDEGEILSLIKIVKNSKASKVDNDVEKIESLCFQAGRKLIKPRTRKQADYFNCVKNKQMIFCCCPAGTGYRYTSRASRTLTSDF